MLIDSILTNYHAFMQCESPESLPIVECSSLPQQRYHLLGQSSIRRIAICVIPKRLPPAETPSIETPSTETPTPPPPPPVETSQEPPSTSSSSSSSSSSSDADSSFEVVAAGCFPFLCFYEISRDSPSRSVGSLAVSVARSLYGAVRSLAGWGWNQAESEKRETLPRAKSVRTSFELADSKREGAGIWASPAGRFVAVADGLNRVVLADVSTGEVLKMWKGWKPGVSLRNRYRKVQCFWTSMGVSSHGARVDVPILGIFISWISRGNGS